MTSQPRLTIIPVTFRFARTYTLAVEPGTSLMAAGWQDMGRIQGHRWGSLARPRFGDNPTGDKRRWERRT